MAFAPLSGRPLISVVMANFEAGEKIVHALRSVLRQTVGDLEVIVSDDCSRDGSLEHVRRLMAEDERIRLITAERNGGPAQCRNRALELARGHWIAIVDSDDIIHPERFERLLAAAAEHGSDIVADDLLLFFEDGTAPRLMLGEDVSHTFLVSTERWVLAGVDGTPALGYLKPLIRADRLQALRYDQELRIGEDYDLLLRLLLEGASMLVVPEPYYLYRRHSGSISHRLSVPDMEAMLERQVDLVERYGPFNSRLTAAFELRLGALRQGLGYEYLVRNIKTRNVSAALALLLRHPGYFEKLWASFAEGRQKRSAPPTTPASPVLELGANGTEHPVPAYVPTTSTDWTAPRQRKVWRDLAARRGAGAVRCVPLDAAGRYAAGFIPEAEIASEPLVFEAAS
ncbi:glycosyltransferase family 2 protein [Devosia soli]|uniref:glycosyltransferase family 2 protein n=1 Tax=Devosia soli TaxID=361041 RepID=UPI000A022B8A|nr:glycosyltransferase family 2 protein [Devosia soli]